MSSGPDQSPAYAPPPGPPAWAGQPQPSGPQPGWGPQPRWGPPPGWGPPPYGWYGRQPGTNGLAIAALVTGITVGPVGLVLGLIALRQIRESGQDGRGLALAGAIVGGVMTLIFVLELVFFVVVATTL